MATRIFTSALLLASLIALTKGTWDANEELCVRTLKLDKTYIQALDDKDVIPENNKNFNKFLECYWKKLGALKANGDINWEKVDDILFESFKEAFGNDIDQVAALASDIVEKAVKKCKAKGIKANSSGEKVAKIQNCINKESFAEFEHL